MDNIRQRAFQKLRPPCIELSSTAIKFRAHQTGAKEILKALEAQHQVLIGLGRDDALDEKLAEYAFWPLSQIFNETQRLSVRCLEIAVRCLQILISQGWRRKLAPDMGKQLLILLNILAGGGPGQSQNKPQSEELMPAAYECMSSLFQNLNEAVFNEVGSATIVDQTAYVLLEGITDGTSDGVQLAAVTSLQNLYSYITDRMILASLLPRTVSALTKTLRPTTRNRRSYKAIDACLRLLTNVLHAVLNDAVAFAATNEHLQVSETEPQNHNSLDESWLKATASQVKLALANVIRLRGHDRPEVLQSLLALCLMVVQDCPKSLADSIPMMIESLIVLSEQDEELNSNEAFSALVSLATCESWIVDILKSSLHSWTISLPRVMQANDDGAKQRALKQIFTSFQILSQSGRSSEILDDTMAVSLCDSVSAAIHTTSSSKTAEALPDTTASRLEIVSFQDREAWQIFQPVVMGHQSQRQTLSELQLMIQKLASSDSRSPLMMARALLSRPHASSGDEQLAAIWLTLSFLTQKAQSSFSIDDLLNFADSTSSTTRPLLIEELYSVALPILLDQFPTANDIDWRLPALALEAVALQAQQLRSSFRPELIDALYPVLQFIGSPNPHLRSHAMTCLNLLARACDYPDSRTMLVDNVDYLVNSIALKLNTFDISPQAPQVLLMMVRLCGASLIPYLDDLIGSIFAALDCFHGYPKLVELLFSVLGAIVDEGVKIPTLSIAADRREPISHLKQPYSPVTVADVAKELAELRAKRDANLEPNSKDTNKHPNRPFTSSLDAAVPPNSDTTEKTSNNLDSPAQETSKPPDPETEPSLTKTHSLLLSIARSTIPHLSSPSPALKTSLLHLLTRLVPTLSQDENSFLPLVNDIWPAIASRLSDEEAYVVVAAVNAIAEICKGSGDFLSSRIEDEFEKWKKLYSGVWVKVEADATRRLRRKEEHPERQRKLPPSTSITLPLAFKPTTTSTTTITTTSTATATPASPSPSPSQPLTHPQHTTPIPTQSPHTQIHTSLLTLFTSILTHVRITADIGDEILLLLSPLITNPSMYLLDSRVYAEVLAALEGWNGDAVWLVRARAEAREQQARTRTGETGDGKGKGRGCVWTGRGVPVVPMELKGEYRFREVVF